MNVSRLLIDLKLSVFLNGQHNAPAASGRLQIPKICSSVNQLQLRFAHRKIDTNSPIGKAVFVIISAIATLERDLISERVRNGLANARAKGKLIGRKKLRDSDLIRKLLKAGLSYRNVVKIEKCSHGSVHAEVLALKRDEAAAKGKEEADKFAEEQLLLSQAKAVSESGILFPEAAA
ncbi:MAG: recombinase family protein [Deltaproteobacteria bacterium]|nr:recombinase family protein [Deltaproteobacteria bacterium]